MDAGRGDELAIEAFRLIRDDLAREFGTEIVLVDNLRFLKLVIRNTYGGDGLRPRYRIALLFKPSKVSIVRRQAGHLAEGPKRIDLVYAATDPLGERFRKAINDLMSHERLRLMDYRKLAP